MAAQDFTGQRFGRLLVIRRSPIKTKQPKWECQCDCGKTTVSFGFSLKAGGSKSCGCIAADKSKVRWADPNSNMEERQRRSAKYKTHGMSKHGAYQSWADMKQRCLNTEHAWYESYGGRGIRIHDLWLSFESFWADMGPTWYKGATIGRKNNEGNYEFSNCAWETSAQQQINRSNTVYIETPVGIMAMSQAARRYGMTVGCIKYRLAEGWSTEDIFKNSQRTRENMTNFDRTAAWLKKAGKQQTQENLNTQIGVHISEFVEMMQELSISGELTKDFFEEVVQNLDKIAESIVKGRSKTTFANRVKFLDSLCDQSVTGDGIAYLAGFDKNGADNEVLRSNESKFNADGSPVILEGGKIGKSNLYKAPSLVTFI